MAIVHSLYQESGRAVIDNRTCSGCGLCAKICPADVLTMDNGKLQVSEDSLLGCIACGHCMMICPEGAIRVSGRGLKPEDLVPLPKAEDRASAEALAALLLSRRSMRHFSAQAVEPELVQRVIELAATAPMGIPPWDVGCVSVIGRQEVRKIANEVIKGYEGFLRIFKPWLLAALRPLLGKAKYELFASFIRPLAQTYVEGHQKGCDKLFYDAPALLIFHTSAYTDALDAGIACTYAMLVAESLGLGSTIIGGAPPILKRNKMLCRRIGIPEGNTPSVALILGYPDANFRKTIRRQFSQVNTVKSG